MNRGEVEFAFILPTYHETKTVFNLILELSKAFPKYSYFIFVDDTESQETAEHIELAFASLGQRQGDYTILRHPTKSGRGAAVKRGMEWGLLNTDARYFVELDSDGSHAASEVLRIVNVSQQFDFVIGSRYRPGSTIIGWPFTRQIFSLVINNGLRILFWLNVSDWTNGLRAYSREAASVLIESDSITTGFIYLSEQLLTLSKKGYYPLEVPIRFANRESGNSTVTYRELIQSVFGVFRLRLKKWDS